MLVFLLILLCAIVYTVPGLIALARRHPGWIRIWLINIFLGFTLIGWLWALRDALRRDAVDNHRVYYRYSYYGEKSRRKAFDLRQLPGAGDVGMALGGLALVAFLGTLAWQHVAPQPVTAAAAAATVASSTNGAQGWTYSQENEAAGLSHVSTLTSDDSDAAGDRMPGTLVLRNGPGGVSAAIRIDGQFTCSAAAGGMIAAQFDGGQVEALPCAPRPDAVAAVNTTGQDTLYIANPESFIARARQAHSLVLTASVLDQGVRNLHFSPQGLDIAQAGLPEEMAVAAATAARPAAAEAPADARTVTAAVPAKPVKAARARLTRIADVRPVRSAVRRQVHRDRQTVLHPFRPVQHHGAHGK